MQNIIFTGNTCILWQNHVLNVFLRWIQYYKHCLPMKAPSVTWFFSVLTLRQLRPIAVQQVLSYTIFQWNSLIFSKFFSNDRIWKYLLHCNGPKLPKCQNTEKSRTDGAFIVANNVYNTEFSVETRLEHGFAIEYTYFLWK